MREAERQLKDAEKLSSEREKAAQEVKDLRTILEQTQARIDALQEDQSLPVESESELRRLQQLRKNLENAKKEVTALTKQAKKQSHRRSKC